MKRLMLGIIVAATPVVAWAQTAQPPQQIPPQVQALQQRVIQLTGESLDWQTQAITLQHRVDDLTKQLTEATKKPESPKEKSPE